VEYNVNRKFTILFMPIIVITIRRNIEIIFRCNYPLLFNNPKLGTTAINNLTLILNYLLDPNMLYSRFSLIPPNIKIKRPKLNTSFRIKQINGLMYTNSALVNSLLEHRSEGKVRARFTDRSIKKNSTRTLDYDTICSNNPRSLSTMNKLNYRDTISNIKMYNMVFKDINRKFSKIRLDSILNTKDIS